MNLCGFVLGNVKVKGNYKFLDIIGCIDLVEMGLKIFYLNVDFNFEDDILIFFLKDKFRISFIFIIDIKYGIVGIFEGNVNYLNFLKWVLDFDLEIIWLLVLDIFKDEDVLYYGIVFISGIFKIVGFVDELVIDVVVMIEVGIKFKIFISDVVSIGDDFFIWFIFFEEKKVRIVGEIYVIEEIKGFLFNFELDIN